MTLNPETETDAPTQQQYTSEDNNDNKEEDVAPKPETSHSPESERETTNQSEAATPENT